jgi:hypothetical protein
MKDDTGSSPGRQRRAGLRASALAAPLAGLALLIAACGGSSSPGGSAANQTPYQKDVAYAACMRSHGEPKFPDPNSQGNFNTGGIDNQTSQYQSANKTCVHLLPSNGQLTAQNQKAVSAALKYAQCMRTHGIATFPDPTVANGGSAIGLGDKNVDQNSSQYQTAQQACKPILTAGG